MTNKSDNDKPLPGDKLVAAMPKDQLRSLFYLFTGKPDSRIKVFESPVHLTRNDIIELNECVMRKLKTHNVEASITSLQIGYGGSHISEFGTWAEFETHHWQEPERIEEIVIKWDFGKHSGIPSPTTSHIIVPCVYRAKARKNISTSRIWQFRRI